MKKPLANPLSVESAGRIRRVNSMVDTMQYVMAAIIILLFGGFTMLMLVMRGGWYVGMGMAIGLADLYCVVAIVRRLLSGSRE